MEPIISEIKMLEEELNELQDLLNCGEYRVDFNYVESCIEQLKSEIDTLKVEAKMEV